MTPQAPLHLAIIPDGNRRWAKSRMMLPWNGHERAMDVFRDLIDWCRDDPRIGTLTIWGFSTENWKRSEEEVSILMRLFEDFLRRERQTLLDRQTRFVHSARLERIPATLAALIRDVSAETAAFTDFTLHLALDYGGRDEVTRAVRRLVEGGSARADAITEDMIRSALDQPSIPDIDLIVRTSGEQRTSNFFLWQSGYAEWFFLPEHFPEVTPVKLDEVLRQFAERQRRFGGEELTREGFLVG